MVEEANRHGFYGATGPRLPTGPPSVALEDIVVGLLMPQGPADGRLFKLVVRILQSDRVDAARVARLARRERADHVLWWLLELVPPRERNDAIERVVVALGGPPRGYRPPRYRYDPKRLLSRGNRELEWPKKPLDLTSKLCRADDLDLADIEWLIDHEELDAADVRAALRHAVVPDDFREGYAEACGRVEALLAARRR